MHAIVPMYKRSGGLPYSRSPVQAVVEFDLRCPATFDESIGSTPTKHDPTLKARCSKKWAVPLVLSVSARLPASIQTPTVDVCAHGECSVAICGRGKL